MLFQVVFVLTDISLDLKSTKKSDTSTSKKNLRSSTSAPVVKTQEKPLEKTQEKTLEKDKSVRSGPRFNKSGHFTVKVANPKQLEKINKLAAIYLTPSVVVDNKSQKVVPHKDGWESQMKDFLI